MSRVPALIMACALATLTACAASDNAKLDAAAAQGSEEVRKIHLSVIRGMLDQGKSQAALAFLDDYKIRFPNDLDASALRGEALLLTGNRDAAEAIFQELLKKDFRPLADFGLGQAYAAKGAWAQATPYYANAVRLDPTNVKYLNNLGYALLKIGDAESAYRYLARATQLDPRDNYVRNNYILAASRSGRVAEVDHALGQFDSEHRKRVTNFIYGWTP